METVNYWSRTFCREKPDSYDKVNKSFFDLIQAVSYLGGGYNKTIALVVHGETSDCEFEDLSRPCRPPWQFCHQCQ